MLAPFISLSLSSSVFEPSVGNNELWSPPLPEFLHLMSHLLALLMPFAYKDKSDEMLSTKNSREQPSSAATCRHGQQSSGDFWQVLFGSKSIFSDS